VRHEFPGIGQRTMLLNARRIGLAAGEQLILLSIEDVTEKREYEALRQQAALLNLAYDAVFVRDMAGKISFWNKGAEELYGWPKKEAIGKSCYLLLRTEFPKDQAEIEIEFLRAARWEGTLLRTCRSRERKYASSRWAA